MNIERQVIELEVKRDNLLKQLETETKLQKELTSKLEDINYLQKMVQDISDKVLSQFSINFESCVNTCLNIIFPNTYKFEVTTKVVTGKCKCEFRFLDYKSNKEVYPIDCCGGGVLDLISFALRLSVCAIRKENPVIVLDEPFKFMSKDKIPFVVNLLKEFSSKYQFIIVTHESQLKDIADNLIQL